MNFVALLVAVFYIFGQFPAEAQLGQCPPYDGPATICLFDPDIHCTSDEQCKQGQKCCPSGCNSICQPTVITPCAYAYCGEGTYCVAVNGRAKCVPLPPKPGRCPRVRYPNFGKCLADCNNDYNCNTTLKCCPNGCSRSCQPVRDPCDNCREGQFCELRDVTCKRPPCNPVATCIDTCKITGCKRGYHCEQQYIYCFTTPCPQPPPACVPDTVCTNYQCPIGQRCIETTLRCLVPPCPVVAQCVNRG